MADINPLPVFAENGEKNTTGLNQADGFPAALKPARQWFNYLFNAVTTKINELAAAVNAINNKPTIQHYGVDDVYMTLKPHVDAQAVHDYFNYGTWERAAGGTYISAAGSSVDGYAFTGGTESGEKAHVITVDEMPSHTHKLNWSGGDDGGINYPEMANGFAHVGEEGNDITIQPTGGGQAMPLKPRTTSFYFWRRIA